MKRVVMLYILLLSWLPNTALAAEHARGKLPADAPANYTLAVIPFYSPEKIWALYSPLVQYLKDATGLPWSLKLYHDHESLINDLCNGQLGAALLGPVPLSRAYSKCGVEPFLVAQGKDGAPFYQSVIISGDSSVKSLPDLRGKRFGMFKGSTAAHIMPAKMLKTAGLDFNKDVRPQFYESQDRIITALLSGEISAAGVKESLYEKFQKERLSVLQTSEPLPNFAFCAHPAWPAKAKAAMAAELRKLTPLSNAQDAETVKAWDDEVKNGFMPPDKGYLPSVLKLVKVYGEIINAPQ